MSVTEVPQSQSSTRSLIERGRDGDRSAWDRVFGRAILRMRRWAHGRLPNSAKGAHETVDLVQDAAARVWTRMHTLDVSQPGDLEAYIRQAVMNRIRDEARKGYARPHAVELDNRLPDNAPSPLGEVLSKEEWARYQRAFALLDVSEREAVIARVHMGYGYEQVAALTGKSSAGAARMTVVRALERLRAAIDRPSD